MKVFAPLPLMIAASMALCPATVAFAQAQSQDPVGDLLRQTGVTDATAASNIVIEERPRDPYDPELPITAELNADIVARDRAIEAADAQAMADYRAREDDYVRRLRQQEADHAAAITAYEAGVARQRAEHGAAMARWQRCADGDRTACVTPQY